MKLKRLELSNFKSFVGNHTFGFPEQPGLYFMSGDNQDESRLEANGAGKSTIWDALTWLIYGATSQGLRAGDVSSWSEDGKKQTTSVVLTYQSSNGEEMHLRRQWNPNSYTLASSSRVEDLVDDETDSFMSELCGSGKPLDLAGFMSSIYFAQGKQMFLDLTPSAKAALFSEILSLDSWLQYSDRSSEAAKSTEASITKITGQIEREQSRIRALSESDLGSFYSNWEETRKKNLAQYKKEVVVLASQCQDARRSEARSSDEVQALAVKINQQDTFVKQARANLETSTKFKASKQEMYLGAKVGLAEAERKHQDLMDDRKCPTCGSIVGRLAKRGHVGEALKVLEKASNYYKEKRIEFKRAQEEFERSERLYEESRELLYQSRDVKLRAKKDELRSAAHRFESLDSQITQLENQIEAQSKAVNPFKEKQDQLENDIRRTTELIQEYKTDLDFLNTTLTGYSWWIKGFKDVRLQQIQEALTQLEIEVNSCLVQLGLVGWSLKFDISKEAKTSRKITKGFFVMVQSPTQSKPVPWEAWSGGEAQRLRLAASLGLGNLIRSTFGIAAPIEIWDEPTNYMSSMGVSDLLTALQNRAQEEGRQIWVVDHHTLGSSAFTGSVKITKRSGSSQVGPIDFLTEGE